MLVIINKKIVLVIVSLICGAAGSANVDKSSDRRAGGQEAQQAVNGSTPSSRSGRQMYKELVDMLFKDNNSVIPPNADDLDKPLNITMLMVLQNLVYLNMKTQTLNIIAWFQIEWRDPSLSWDMDVYPVDMIVVSEKIVWRPLLVVINTLLSRDQIMKIELPVSVFADGTVRWFPGDSLLIDCQVDLRFYPFDVQTCEVKVSQWSHQAHHFFCTGTEIRADVNGNGEWDVVGLDYDYKVVYELDYSYWLVTYKITLKRKWMFYVINLIFPIILVTALNNVVFVLPVDSSDKMSVSVTAFLTLMVFLTLIQDALAKNSDTVCYLTLYLSVQMTLGALAVVQSAVVVAFNHKSVHTNTARDTEHNLHNISLSGHCSSPSDTDGLWEPRELRHNDHVTEENDYGQLNRFVDFQPRHTPEYQSSHTPARTMSGRHICGHDSDGERGSNSTGIDWQRVAARIDSICLPVFLILNALSLIIFCVIWSA